MLGVCPEGGHDISGVRSRGQLQQSKLYRPEEYDSEVEINNRDAGDMCQRLNREESIIAGLRSGEALVGALSFVPDTFVVVIFADNVFTHAASITRHFPASSRERGPCGV